MSLNREPYTNFLTGETAMLAGNYPDGMIDCIRDFLADDAKRTSGLDVYPEVFGTPLMFPLQRMREMEKMIRIARKVNPVTVMEIGADKGGSLYHWCKCLPTVKRVIACEVRGLPYAGLFTQAFADIEFLWLPQSSYGSGAYGSVKDWMGKVPPYDEDKIDVLFIDGDKAHFQTDFDLYLPLMSKNGVVFLHDVCEEPMRGVFRNLCKRYKSDHIVDTAESWETHERAVKGVPVASAYDGWLRYWNGRSCTVGAIYPGQPV